MGYDVHITRAEDWTDSDASPISLDDWLQYVESAPDMRLDGYAEVATPDGSIRYEAAGLAVWTAYSGNDADGSRAWFDYHDGRIVVKNPDEEILAKMILIANALSARVVGDDGELYPAAPAAASKNEFPSKKRPLWRFW